LRLPLLAANYLPQIFIFAFFGSLKFKIQKLKFKIKVQN